SIGPIDHVVDAYSQSLEEPTDRVNFRGKAAEFGTGEVRIAEATIQDRFGRPCSLFQNGDDVVVEFQLETTKAAQDQMCVVIVRTSTGVPVLHLTAHDAGSHGPTRVPGTSIVRCVIPRCQLYPGIYTVSIWIGSSAHLDTDCRTEALRFRMEPGDLLGLGFD